MDGPDRPRGVRLRDGALDSRGRKAARSRSAPSGSATGYAASCAIPMRPEALYEIAEPLAAVWIIGRVLGSVLVVPIVEELAFRGFLLRRIIGSDFDRVSYEQWSWLAVLGSSLLFAAFHQQWIGGFVAGVL